MLRISQDDYDSIRAQAEQCYPNEGCGILLGNPAHGNRNISAIFPCDNAHPQPLRRYTIDPKQVIAAQKLARNQGVDIIGFYHSHPDHPAQYSETDLAEAHWLDCSYVITSVKQGKATETRSFVLSNSEENKVFVEEEIQAAGTDVKENTIAADLADERPIKI